MVDHLRSLSEYEQPLTEAPEYSFTLPSSLYTDPAVYEVEKERIFYRSWQFVAHRSSFQNPGDYVTARICDQNIFVMMGGDGELRAFYNVCQHRAHELLPDGSGNVSRNIVCPYHAWVYEREGALRGAPRARQRPDFNKADYALKSIRHELFLDCVFVNVSSDAVPLAEQAADLEADVRSRVPFYGRLGFPQGGALGQYKIEAGWKVVVDNYVECYHCDHAHPDFADLISMKSYQHDTFGLWARQIGEEIKASNSAYELAEDSAYMRSTFWFLWPNTTFNILPGGEEMNIAAIRPLGHEYTDFSGFNLSADGSFDPARAEYTNNVLMPEDVALCESVQRGLKSRGYSQGPIIVDTDRSGRSEHAIHHFHRLVQKALSE